MALTGEQLDRFHADGYLPLGALMSAAELESLRRRTDDLTAGRVPTGRVGFQLDEKWRRTGYDATGYAYAGPSDGYRKIGGLEWDPVFYPVIAGAATLDVIGQLIPQPLAIHRAMILMKPAHGGTALGWHQDTGTGFPVPGTSYFTIWTALDDAGAENGPCTSCRAASTSTPTACRGRRSRPAPVPARPRRKATGRRWSSPPRPASAIC